MFYRTSDDKITVATYSVSGNSFRADKPRLWADVEMQGIGANRNFDLHPNGKRFAILKSSEAPAEEKRDKVTLVENFFDELRRIAPAAKK